MKRHEKKVLKNSYIVILILLFFLISYNPSFAQNITQIGPGLYQVGIKTSELQYFVAPETNGRQRQSNWCWAACIQMVLNYHGIYVTQEQIVTRVFGKLINSRANLNHILAGLQGWALQNNKNPVVVTAYKVNKWSDLVKDLAYRKPMIVVLRNTSQGSHAYVLTAATYYVDSRNEPIFRTLVLRDPWPRNQSRLELGSRDFFNRLDYIIRVGVNRM
jgi:hypothetical protein